MQGTALASQALRLRALALSSWEQGDPPPDVAALFLESRDLYARATCPSSAAVSATLAALLLTEHGEPLEALSHFDQARPHLIGPRYLILLARLGQALCFSRLDDCRHDALALLPDPSACVLDSSEETIAAQWLLARVKAILQKRRALPPLIELFGRLLDNRRYGSALLAALDLCQHGASPTLVTRLQRRLDSSLPRREPHSTWLRAFHTLASDLNKNVPFAKAAGAFPVLVPSIHRFLSLDLLLDAPMPHLDLTTPGGRIAHKILRRFPEHREVFESEARRLQQELASTDRRSR